MSKKKKGGQATRAQQQQQVAAKRHIAAPAARQGAGRRATEPSASQPGHRKTHLFLDVSAVRIQEWLARTPDLKFRRGASALLTDVTAAKAWAASPPDGMRWNDQAGEVAGVVTLYVDDGIADADQVAASAAAARAVAARMRELMPQCHIQAVTGTGETYADAYPLMERARRDGEFLLDSPPAPAEVIVAKPCDQCRSAAATEMQVEVVSSEPRKDLCKDCRNRLDAAGWTRTTNPDRWPVPEQRLKQALDKAGIAVKGFPGTFAEMAESGREREDNAATQLALIYADGNRVGAFLSEAAKGSGRVSKTDIAKTIDEAAVGALADAVAERFPDQAFPPVIAHIAGGDDLLVSVPAVDAWVFTRALLTAFAARIGAYPWPRQLVGRTPTLSAGIVFHHVKDPFSDVVRLAEDQLKYAKREGRGLAATVAFLDMTADGSQPPAERRPVTLAYLELHARELDQLGDIPNSRIATLLALYRQQNRADLVRRLTDLENQPLWDVIAGTDAGTEQVRKVLDDQPGRLEELRRLLDLARHWTARPQEVSA
jgi:hypothetical protein